MPARLLSFLFATNAAPIAANAEWLLGSPWGTFPNEAGLQEVTADSVQEMVQAFNRAKQASGANWRGRPIYEGHPMHPEANRMGWTNWKAIGRVYDMEPRADGLYCKVAWNEDGERNARNQQLPFPSMGWYLGPAKDGKRAPVAFDHIGMTETPNIPGVTAWNSEFPAAADATADDDTTTTTNDMKKQLCTLLGLDPECADEDVIAAVTKATEAMNSMKEKDTACNAAIAARDEATTLATNERTRADTAAAQVTKLTTERDAALAVNAKAIDAALNIAVNGGIITKAQRDEWQPKLAANASAFDDLAKLTPAMNTKPLVIDRKAIDQAKLAVNAANDEIAKLVGIRKNQTGEGFLTAFNAVCADPANAALVAAANGTKAVA